MYCVSFSLFITENANVELKKKKNDKKIKNCDFVETSCSPRKVQASCFILFFEAWGDSCFYMGKIFFAVHCALKMR